MSVRTLLTLSLLGLLLVGCAGQKTTRLRSADSSAPYLLDSGDRLRVVVFGQDTLTNAYTVDGGGHIAMPLIGAVKARGATVRQLEQSITRQLSVNLLRDPNVTVGIENYRPFFILGEVRNPGQYPFVSGMNVQTAVAIAGGFTPQARKSSVEITRQLSGHVVHDKAPVLYPIRPGDTINVKERLF